MPDGTTQIQSPDTQPALTKEQLEWTHGFTGKDPSGGTAPGAGAASTTSMTAAAAPSPAAAAAPGASAPPPGASATPAVQTMAASSQSAPATPPTPAELRADLNRRVQASGTTYDRLGSAADNVVDEKNKLQPAEQKVGRVIVDDGRTQTIQTDKGSTKDDYALDGKRTRTTIDEKGVTVSGKTTTTGGWVGADGKAAELTLSKSQSTNYGIGNISETESHSRTHSEDGKTTTVSGQRSTSFDYLKGDVTDTKSHSTETKQDGVTTKNSTKDTVSIGLSGYNVGQETSTQTGSKMESQSASYGVVRGNGQLGGTASFVQRTGEMKGEGEQQFMDKGREVSGKASNTLISNDKGVGVGSSGGAGVKQLLGGGNSLNANFGGGGKIQSLVKEVMNSNPPKFQITTTISFDVSAGGGYSYETPQSVPLSKKDQMDPNTKAGGDSQNKYNAGISVTAAASATSTFKRDLEDKEAESYLKCIKENGRGSRLPEHLVLAEGATKGWEAAAHLLQLVSSPAKAVKDMKPGQEMEVAIQGSVGGKLSLGGAQKATGGAGIGLEGGATDTQKGSFKMAVLPGDKVRVTIAFDGNLDVSGSVSVSSGMVRGQGRGAHSSGDGKTGVFVINQKDAKDPAKPNPEYEKQMGLLEAIHSIAALEKFEKEHPDLMESHTIRDSKSTSLGVTVGVGPALVPGPEVSANTKQSESHEQTLDNKGQVIATKDTGGADVDVQAGVTPDVSAKEADGGQYTGQTKTDTDTGEVDAAGQLSDKQTRTDTDKTVDNVVLAVKSHNLLAMLTGPASLKGEKVSVSAMELERDDILAICQESLDATKWAHHCEGVMQKEWAEVGKKIQALTEVKDGQAVSAKFPRVQRVLADWNKSLTGSKTHAMHDVLRPKDGGLDDKPVHGKGNSWPDGTDAIKALWDSLIGGFNPLKAAHKKIKTDPAGALADIRGYLSSLQDLSDKLGDNDHLWKNDKQTYAEMHSHVATRMDDASKAEQEAEREATPVLKGGSSVPEVNAFVAMHEQIKHRDQFDALMERMEAFFKTTFASLWPHQQALEGKGGPVDPEAIKTVLQQAWTNVKLWKVEYAKAEALFKTFSPIPSMNETKADIDKMGAEMTKIHPHGAEERIKALADALKNRQSSTVSA